MITINKNHSRYSSYKDSGIDWLGEIPSEWESIKFKYISRIQTSSIDKHIKPELKQINILHYNDVVKNNFVDSSYTFDKGSCTSSQYSSFRLYENDIIVTKDSMDKNNIADACLITEDLSNTAFGYHLSKIAPYKNLVNSKYLLHFLSVKNLKDYFILNSSGTTIIGLAKSTISNTSFTLPPLPEQQTIASYLDEKTSLLDKTISAKKKQIELLKEKRVSLINKAVTKGLDDGVEMKDSGIEWIGEVPESWEIGKLKYYGDAIIGLTYSPENLSDSENGTLVLRSSNIQNGKLTYKDNVYVNKIIPKKLITQIGDILICSRNGSRRLIGKNSCIDKYSVNCSFGAFMTIFRTKYYKFLSYSFNSSLFKSQSGSFLTSTINQLTTGNLNNMIIPIPGNLKEQQKIVDYLDIQTEKIDTTISKIEESIYLLNEYKTSLISNVVTGKVKMV